MRVRCICARVGVCVSVVDSIVRIVLVGNSCMDLDDSVGCFVLPVVCMSCLRM